MLGGAGPYAVVAIRFAVGGVVLLPWACRRPSAAGELRAVLWCSVALLAGYLLLTVGLERTTSTAAAFITYLLVVFVPLLAAATTRRLPSRAVAAGVVVATIGLLLLIEWRRPGFGELLCLGCAVAFAVHILLLDVFATRIDVVRLTAWQLLVVGAGAAVPATIAGQWRGLSGGALGGSLFLAAAGVGGLLLQIIGQRRVGPTRTSLLLLFEPVLAAIGGYAIGERLGPGGVLGAGLILGGIALSELDGLRGAPPALDHGVKSGG